MNPHRSPTAQGQLYYARQHGAGGYPNAQQHRGSPRPGYMGHLPHTPQQVAPGQAYHPGGYGHPVPQRRTSYDAYVTGLPANTHGWFGPNVFGFLFHQSLTNGAPVVDAFCVAGLGQVHFMAELLGNGCLSVPLNWIYTQEAGQLQQLYLHRQHMAAMAGAPSLYGHEDAHTTQATPTQPLSTITDHVGPLPLEEPVHLEVSSQAPAQPIPTLHLPLANNQSPLAPQASEPAQQAAEAPQEGWLSARGVPQRRSPQVVSNAGAAPLQFGSVPVEGFDGLLRSGSLSGSLQPAGPAGAVQVNASAIALEPDNDLKVVAPSRDKTPGLPRPTVGGVRPAVTVDAGTGPGAASHVAVAHPREATTQPTSHSEAAKVASVTHIQAGDPSGGTKPAASTTASASQALTATSTVSNNTGQLKAEAASSTGPSTGSKAANGTWSQIAARPPAVQQAPAPATGQPVQQAAGRKHNHTSVPHCGVPAASKQVPAGLTRAAAEPTSGPQTDTQLGAWFDKALRDKAQGTGKKSGVHKGQLTPRGCVEAASLSLPADRTAATVAAGSTQPAAASAKPQQSVNTVPRPNQAVVKPKKGKTGVNANNAQSTAPQSSEQGGPGHRSGNQADNGTASAAAASALLGLLAQQAHGSRRGSQVQLAANLSQATSEEGCTAASGAGPSPTNDSAHPFQSTAATQAAASAGEANSASGKASSLPEDQTDASDGKMTATEIAKAEGPAAGGPPASGSITGAVSSTTAEPHQDQEGQDVDQVRQMVLDAVSKALENTSVRTSAAAWMSAVRTVAADILKSHSYSGLRLCTALKPLTVVQRKLEAALYLENALDNVTETSVAHTQVTDMACGQLVKFLELHGITAPPDVAALVHNALYQASE